MHLAQHHFQAQCRYFESAIHFTLSSVFPSLYGLVSVSLDDDALWNGSVSLVEATGVMPDGLAFSLGEGDTAPAARDVASLLPTGAESAVVCLAIPPYRRRHANCEGDSVHGGTARFSVEEMALFDETTGEDERTVEVGRKNFTLVAQSALGEGMVGLPVARIRADGTGHYIFDPNFIPPCIQISGSQRLTSMVRRLVEMLEAKVSSLASMRPGAGRAMSEMAGHELTTYWLTHAVYTGLAPLRHHQDSGRGHPRDLYEVLIRLAGALCTFSLEADVSDIPAYDHGNPEPSFAAVERLIRESLDVVVPESFIGVPLTLTQAHLYTAALADKRTVGPGEWVLRFRSSAPTPFVITEVPRRMKVCSAEDVMRLVADANPALTIEHLPSPPSAIAPRVGSHYFRVRREGPSWKLIQARNTVGVYVPDAFPDAEVELLVVPE